MASVSAQAFWIVRPGVGELRPVDVPEPGPSQVRVRTLYTGVSRGTESLVFHGEVPESEYERMRGPHQEGSLALPVKYGYCLVGEVVDGVEPGRIVFCLHPHQSQVCVDADAVTELPEGLPPARAVLTANMETALNATWDGRVGPGDRVVVVGGGVVGSLVAYICGHIPGTHVQIIDVDEARHEIAKTLGVEFAQPPDSWKDADVVFHASATSAGLQTALDAAGTESRVVELSWYGDRGVQLRLGARFHPGRVQIVSSQVGRIPPERAPRWTYGRRLGTALDLLRDPALDVLISGESRFGELPAVMPRILAPATGGSTALCHRICY